MITLYQIHWSHYVEKVRWALDHKGVAWKAVEVDPLTKRQMHHLKCKLTLESGHEVYTVPVIHDEAANTVVGDSSRILEYLERAYPEPALFPADPGEYHEVKRWMLWLDSTLGLAARRLCYTQIAVEQPGILATLFVPDIAAGEPGSVKARLTGIILAGVLARRFRFLQNRADRVFEELEQCLLIAAGRLSTNRFLVGGRFSAADLTLAALSRPVRLVPFFRDHPGLGQLWRWRAQLLEGHHREAQAGYESALHAARQRRGWALGAVPWMARRGADDVRVGGEIPRLSSARNDQQSVGRWPVILGPLGYARLRLTCGLGRTEYR